MTPKVTIIIPAYKDSFIKESIKSLLQQTYSNYNIVIVDDASPYDLKRIINEFSTTRIQYYRNEINIGGTDLVANWNKALMYADGDLVVLGSDDDRYHPDFLKSLVALSIEYPQVDVFHCRVGVINDAGEPISWGPAIAEYETDIDFIYQRAINRRTQLISDFMFRRKALMALGGFVNYPKAWYSDEMTVYQLAKGKGVVASSDTLFYWRSSNQNISSINTDTYQKAIASVMHIKNMNDFVLELEPKNEADRFLLSDLRQRIGVEIKRQLIYDMAKSPIEVNFKIYRKYPSLLNLKENIKLIGGWIRHRIGV